MDLSKLAFLARLATPGPWAADMVLVRGSGLHGSSTTPIVVDRARRCVDADFIAAASPDVVLEMVERIVVLGRLAGELTSITKIVGTVDTPELTVSVVEEMRRQSERCNWIATHGGPRPREEWCEEDGSVLWWKFPVVEPPYLGSTTDEDFPDYVTHWTRIPIPEAP